MFFTVYSFMTDMGQVLRGTHQDKDHTFQIINSKIVGKETQEIQVLLDGVTVSIIKEGNVWRPKDHVEQMPVGLISAIGKAIALRYRF